VNKTYGEAKKGNGGLISLPAGEYRLEAKSVAGELPKSCWDNPVYGVTKSFTITAGEETPVGELTCTLLQCKVTVEYSDDFLKMVTGAGKTTVTVADSYPLDFNLSADKTYDRTPGYFAVEGTTMTVVFKGNIEGKTAKMTKTFTNVEPRQWRHIKFIPVKNEEGNATFDIVIQDLISDSTLNNDLNAEEDILGEDPDKPKGDGGITLDFDYEAGCDQDLTDLNNMVIVKPSEKKMCIKLKALVPNGIFRFTVDIQSDSDGFNFALESVNAFKLDLVNPDPAHDKIFEVVPFPHGKEALLGKTEVEFDLSPAQEPITGFSGKHKFIMNIMDNENHTKTIEVTMIVNK
jgi:hypothetical protein